MENEIDPQSENSAEKNTPPEDTDIANGTDEKTAVENDTAQNEIAELAEKLANAEVENAKLKNLYVRANADLDNYRKRVTREKEELRKFAMQDLIEDLIPNLDNLAIGLASAAAHPEAAPVTEGFKMVADQIKMTLAKHGLEEINPQNDTFDPNFHEAVSQMPSDTAPEHGVAQVLRVGYKLHDRLVRPASVIVSTGKPA